MPLEGEVGSYLSDDESDGVAGQGDEDTEEVEGVMEGDGENSDEDEGSEGYNSGGEGSEVSLTVAANYASYTQVRHNGQLTLRLVAKDGQVGDYGQKFCTLHGNILLCYNNKTAFNDNSEPEQRYIVRGLGAAHKNNRSFIIECEEGESLQVRCKLASDKEEWTQALSIMQDLLLDEERRAEEEQWEEDEEACDDEDDTTAHYRHLINKLFKRQEKLDEALVQFQVDKTELARMDSSSLGVFNNGDTYLVMSSRWVDGDLGGGTKLERAIYYWVGSKASMDKAMVASIKAVELRRGFGGRCSTLREEEGSESPEFLWLFGGEVRVKDAQGSAPALQKVVLWSDMPPTMYVVTARNPPSKDELAELPTNIVRQLKNNFTMYRVNMESKQLDSKRVVLVDNHRGIIYLWCGAMATFKQRGFGLEAATCLRSDNPKGSKVEQIDEKDEPEEFLKLMEDERQRQQEEWEKTVPDPDDPTPEEEKEYEDLAFAYTGHGLSLYRIRLNPDVPTPEGRPSTSFQLSLMSCVEPQFTGMSMGGLEPELDDLPPLMSMLESSAAFVLDCFTEMYVWYGTQAPSGIRVGAVKVGNRLLASLAARPRWVNEVMHVREGKEPFLFRVKFQDWGLQHKVAAGPRDKFFQRVRTIADTQKDPAAALAAKCREVLKDNHGKEIETAQDKAVHEAGFGDDLGMGPLEVHQLKGGELWKVKKDNIGQFQQDSTYVLLYAMEVSQEADGSDQSEQEKSVDEGEGSNDDDDDDDLKSHSNAESSGEFLSADDGTAASFTSLHDDSLEEGSEGDAAAAAAASSDDDDSVLFEAQAGAASEYIDEGLTYDDLEAPTKIYRAIIYFWQGSRFKKSDWVLWSLQLAKGFNEYAEEKYRLENKNDIPVVRVESGIEPLHLKRVLSDGAQRSFVIHDSAFSLRPNPERTVSLYKVMQTAKGLYQTFQVPPLVSNFSTRHVFICLSKMMRTEYENEMDEVCLWSGALAPMNLSQKGSEIAVILMQQRGMNTTDVDDVLVIEEDEQEDTHAELWDKLSEQWLGGETTYAIWPNELPEEYIDLAEANDVGELDDLPLSKLYISDTSSGQIGLVPYGAIKQEALKPGVIAVLDTSEGLYVWKGSKANERHYRIISRGARRYGSAKKYEWGRRLAELTEDNETLEFKAHFQVWNDVKSAGFVDPYDKRLERLEIDGKLGAVKFLRGRVLTDAEAKNHWNPKANNEKAEGAGKVPGFAKFPGAGMGAENATAGSVNRAPLEAAVESPSSASSEWVVFTPGSRSAAATAAREKKIKFATAQEKFNPSSPFYPGKSGSFTPPAAASSYNQFEVKEQRVKSQTQGLIKSDLKEAMVSPKPPDANSKLDSAALDVGGALVMTLVGSQLSEQHDLTGLTGRPRVRMTADHLNSSFKSIKLELSVVQTKEFLALPRVYQRGVLEIVTEVRQDGCKPVKRKKRSKTRRQKDGVPLLKARVRTLCREQNGWPSTDNAEDKQEDKGTGWGNEGVKDQLSAKLMGRLSTSGRVNRQQEPQDGVKGMERVSEAAGLVEEHWSVMLTAMVQLPNVPGLRREPNRYVTRTLARSGMRPNTTHGSSRKFSGSQSMGLALNDTMNHTMNQTMGQTMGDTFGASGGYVESGMMGTLPASRQTSRPNTAAHLAVTNRIPEYVTKEKQVLRFCAYFQESVNEGGSMDKSGFRVRKFVLQYFVADDTICLEEPRIVNSGLTQGKFMKRAKVAKPKSLGGGYYTAADIIVGQEIWILGRRFRIVDADRHTREWYSRELKLTQGEQEDYPDDGYAQERARFDKAGSKTQSNGREKGEYYKKDRKVLRFFCKYQDDRLQGDKRDYILYYYLLNDTVEIKEIPAEGRHNFPNLLRRQKLPKDSNHVPTGYGGVISPRDPQRERVPSVTWQDLRCGDAMSVYGRNLLLMSCDSSTAEWYAKRGIHQRTLTIGHEDVESLNDIQVAPYNGYGNEDDLYAMGLSLEPMNKEVNNEEYERFLKGDKKVCRFKAKLHKASGNDASREFVVNYFLADDTLSVFEPPVRNSGVIGGLFLARGKYKKYIPAIGQVKEGTRASEKMTMDGGLLEARIGLGGQLSRWLRTTDFIPGSIITFEMPASGSKLFTLNITGYDEYTRKLLEDQDIFPQNTAQLAMTRISEVFASAKMPLRSIFRGSDPECKGVLPIEEFVTMLNRLQDEAESAPSAKQGAKKLTEEELSEIVREFAPEVPEGSEAVVQYDDFIDVLVVASPQCAKLKDRARNLKVEERVLKTCNQDFEDRAGGGGLRKIFRKYDPSGSGGIGQSDWIQVLRETHLNIIMTRQVAEALYLEHDTAGNGQLDYNALCDGIFAGDFRHFELKNEERPETVNPESAITIPEEALLCAKHQPPPTVKSYLKKVNEKAFRCNEDEDKQILRAMRSFGSAFSRANRKKMIRKHFLAFDVNNTAKIGKHQFLETVDEVAAEFFIDFDTRDRDLLAHFFFPRENGRIDYDELLDIINVRDVRRAHAFRQRTIKEGSDYEEIFSCNDNAARTRDFGGTLNLFASNA